MKVLDEFMVVRKYYIFKIRNINMKREEEDEKRVI